MSATMNFHPYVRMTPNLSVLNQLSNETTTKAKLENNISRGMGKIPKQFLYTVLAIERSQYCVDDIAERMPTQLHASIAFLNLKLALGVR